MQKLSTSLKKLEKQKKPVELFSKPCLVKNDTELPLREDCASKELLCRSLTMFYNSLKTYGKDESQLDDLTIMFKWALEDYPYSKIQNALRFYAKNYDEMPTPADIVSIIERNGKPPFERAIYIGLTKKPKEELLDEEWEYIREYEEWAISGGQ